MTEHDHFQERIVRVDRPTQHYTLLRSPTGAYLGTVDGSALGTLARVDDAAVWERSELGYEHVATGMGVTLESDSDDSVCVSIAGQSEQPTRFVPIHGPAHLPSEYLRDFRANGWVCLPCILSLDTVEGLQRASHAGRWSDQPLPHRRLPLTEDVAIARTAAEPVSLWLMRQYLQTDDIRLAHTPSFVVLDKDDGKQDVQGWHSDFPYLWGISARVGGDRIPPGASGEVAMAIQRNVCITDFSKENGATCFKLGSHAENIGPPEDWGRGSAYSQEGYRAEHGLPYSGPEADVVEAPAGSMVLYDARTWHRAGVNRTDQRRAGLLQAITPSFIMPFVDTSAPYRAFLESPLHDELTSLEQQELGALLVHKIIGPMGQAAIGIDEELTRQSNADSTSVSSSW